MSRALRVAAVAMLIVLTVTLQISVFDRIAVDGVVPDLALIVVVAAALVSGPSYAAAVGFAAGLALDLAPPADHTAGRWALSLVAVGYLAGLAKPEGDGSWLSRVFLVAAGAFVGTSLFALTGLALGDPGVTVAAVFDVVPRAVGYDVLIAPLALPLTLAALRRAHPAPRW